MERICPSSWYYLFRSSENPYTHIAQMKSDPKVLVLFLPVVMDVVTLADSTTLSNGGVLVGRAGAWVVGLSRRKHRW